MHVPGGPTINGLMFETVKPERFPTCFRLTACTKSPGRTLPHQSAGPSLTTSSTCAAACHCLLRSSCCKNAYLKAILLVAKQQPNTAVFGHPAQCSRWPGQRTRRTQSPDTDNCLVCARSSQPRRSVLTSN
eukprot:3834519-Rhodomonas_salina.1